MLKKFSKMDLLAHTTFEIKKGDFIQFELGER